MELKKRRIFDAIQEISDMNDPVEQIKVKCLRDDQGKTFSQDEWLRDCGISYPSAASPSR